MKENKSPLLSIHILTVCGENEFKQCIQILCIVCKRVYDNPMLAYKEACNANNTH